MQGERFFQEAVRNSEKGHHVKMIFKSALVSFLCVLFLAPAQPSRASDAKDTNQRQRAASAIFDDIMQTLPGDMKTKVDSAGVMTKNGRPVSASKAHAAADSRSSSQTSAMRRDEAAGSLPDDVRGQVEKAISDIDLMNQSRQIQFKEYEKRHPGSR
jgi:hypothetical protein